jgi:hypothetical protein
MIEEFNTDDFAGINQSSRDSQVFLSWFGITTWMIMRHHES